MGNSIWYVVAVCEKGDVFFLKIEGDHIPLSYVMWSPYGKVDPKKPDLEFSNYLLGILLEQKIETHKLANIEEVSLFLEQPYSSSHARQKIVMQQFSNILRFLGAS